MGQSLRLRPANRLSQEYAPHGLPPDRAFFRWRLPALDGRRRPCSQRLRTSSPRADSVEASADSDAFSDGVVPRPNNAQRLCGDSCDDGPSEKTLSQPMPSTESLVATIRNAGAWPASPIQGPVGAIEERSIRREPVRRILLTESVRPTQSERLPHDGPSVRFGVARVSLRPRCLVLPRRDDPPPRMERSAAPFMVKDINPGSGSSYPDYLTDVNGTLFFTASDGASGQELWRTDATEAGTVLVKRHLARQW